MLPIKSENNRFFPLFNDVKNNITKTNIEYFRSQKWRKDTWLVLNQINDKSQKIASNCNDVTNFINYTKDAFIYMIAKKYINSNQYIFWYLSIHRDLEEGVRSQFCSNYLYQTLYQIFE